jgi:hypothetical protein
MLNKRDRAIISNLNKFRVMDRDSIAELHFASLKNPQYSANNVLLRLLRDGHIQRSTAFVPYVYFGPDVSMKKNSAKIGHFLAILNVYKEMRKLGAVEEFRVEPKYGSKGTVEPDIYCKFRRTPFFIEVQKSIYSQKQMSDKMNRYLDLYNSDILGEVKPHVLIIAEQRYAVDDYPFKVFQTQSFTQFVESLKQKPQPIKAPSNNGISVRIG